MTASWNRGPRETRSGSTCPCAGERLGEDKPLERDSLPPGRGSDSRPARQRLMRICGTFPRVAAGTAVEGCARRRRKTSLCVALTKDVSAMYPRVAQAGDKKSLFAGPPWKPSDGRDPSAP